MITKLDIKNFKSIIALHLDCKRVNVFIGEPNTGKSNILEALGFLSFFGHHNRTLKDYVRFLSTYNIFHDNLVDNPVEIILHTSKPSSLSIKMEFGNNQFNVAKSVSTPSKAVTERYEVIDTLSYDGQSQRLSGSSDFEFLKFYRFKSYPHYPGNFGTYLLPPDGENLFTMVMGHKKLRETFKSFFSGYSLKVVLKPAELKFEVQKEEGDLVFNYPYELTSDTLQRMIFYAIAIESNRDSTLILEEPETHAFPYYTKWLGEKIGSDPTNQYFIATHNPYLLQAILEKTSKDDLQVFVAYYRDYQTRVVPLNHEQVSGIMSSDPFFNLDDFIPDDDS